MECRYTKLLNNDEFQDRLTKICDNIKRYGFNSESNYTIALISIEQDVIKSVNNINLIDTNININQIENIICEICLKIDQ